MEIKLVQSQSGTLVLVLQGMFRRQLEAVHFDRTDHFLYLTFEGVKRPEQLDCPIPEEMMAHLLTQRYMLAGFFEDRALKATQLVPFLVHNLTEKELGL